MYSLETIKSLNARPAIRRDNFNRDSSFVESRSGFVIHSGIHRSTAFISKEDHADAWFAFQYWSKQGQAAVNAFIEVIIDGGDLETAEQNAFRKSRPRWGVILPKSQGTQGNRQITAKRTLRGFETRVGALTWRHLHARTK